MSVISSVTISPPIVVATATELNAPMISSTAAAATASRGRIAPLATDVATAFAASWKPFVKSNSRATPITTMSSKGMGARVG